MGSASPSSLCLDGPLLLPTDKTDWHPDLGPGQGSLLRPN
jgi:hypothetical protein